MVNIKALVSYHVTIKIRFVQMSYNYIKHIVGFNMFQIII